MEHSGTHRQFLYKNYLSQPLVIDTLQLFQVFEAEYTSASPLNTSSYMVGGFLVYCMNGKGLLRLGDREVPFEGEDVMYCPEREGVTVESLSADETVRCLVVHFAVLDKPYSVNQSALELYFAGLLDVHISSGARMINEVYSHLMSELSSSQPHFMMLRCFMTQLLTLAYRAFSSHLTDTTSEDITLNAVGHTVYAIIRYVDEHLFSMQNLMGMALELGYSYNYLSHLFRRKTGMTIQAYVSRKKIDKSVELLSDEALSITEIASMLNYDCIQSFSKAFRRSMGMSPTEYRSLHGLKNS